MKTSLRPHMEFFTKKFLKSLKQNSPRSKGQFSVPCDITININIIIVSLPPIIQMVHLAFEPYSHTQLQEMVVKCTVNFINKAFNNSYNNGKLDNGDTRHLTTLHLTCRK